MKTFSQFHRSAKNKTWLFNEIIPLVSPDDFQSIDSMNVKGKKEITSSWVWWNQHYDKLARICHSAMHARLEYWRNLFLFLSLSSGCQCWQRARTWRRLLLMKENVIQHVEHRTVKQFFQCKRYNFQPYWTTVVLIFKSQTTTFSDFNDD